MADNRPEIGFIFEVDDRASQKLDRIADQMDRINRAQQGIAGGGARVGGLADQYRDGPTAGSPSGGAAGGTATGQQQGFQYQQWSNDPDVRRMQQEADARMAQERMRYANNQFVGNTPYMQDIAKSPAFSDRDFERELIRHKEHLREIDERQMKNEKDYNERRVGRMKEWEQREENRHVNQIKRDKIRVQEFEDSQKRLTKHMYGSNFLGEFFAELGFVIFEQFQQGVQEYAADIDAQGYEYSGAGGELAGARRFQSRFGDFQRGMGEAVVAVGGALEDTFGTLFESGETTSQREFVEGLGRTREELERIAGIDRTDGMSALSALLQQIDRDKLDPGALGAAVDELERLGTLGLGSGPGGVGLGHAQHAIITGGLSELQNLSGNMDWERMILGGGTDPAQLNQGGWADDPRFQEARAEKWLNLQTQMNEKRYNPDSGDLDKYLGQINNIARAMQEAGLLTDQWAGGTIALHAAIVEATDDTKLADQVVRDYTAAQEANNQRMVDASKVSAEATKEYDIFTRGMKRGQDEILDLDYAMMEFEKTIGNTDNALKDNTQTSRQFREEFELVSMALDAIPVTEFDMMFKTFMNDGQIDEQELLQLIEVDLASAIRNLPDQKDVLINLRINQYAQAQQDAMYAPYTAQLAEQFGPMAGLLTGPLAGQISGEDAFNMITSNTATQQERKYGGGGSGSKKKTATQAWIEERTKLLQDGATIAEVDALEDAFRSQYDKEAWEKDYDQPGYLTAYDYGVKQINERIEAEEDAATEQKRVEEEGYEALGEIDKQIADLRVKAAAHKDTLGATGGYEGFLAQIDQLEEQKKLLEEQLDQGTLTQETLELIEEQAEFWAERNYDALERSIDKMNEMKEELKEKFDETIKALSTSQAMEMAGMGGVKPDEISQEEWDAAAFKNAMVIEVGFAKASLMEAERYGDPAEIAKQKKRLETAQENLNQANRELSEARLKAQRQDMTTDERVRADLGEGFETSTAGQDLVRYFNPRTGQWTHATATEAYIGSLGIDNNSEEAINIRRGINTASREQGADFTLGDSADASAEEALAYWTQGQSGSSSSDRSAGTTSVTINLGDGTTIESQTAEVIVEEQG